VVPLLWDQVPRLAAGVVPSCFQLAAAPVALVAHFRALLVEAPCTQVVR
jgi:hypothetical protein